MWFFLLLVLAVTLVYYLLKPGFYWKRRNVTQTSFVPIFGNNLKNFLRTESFFDMMLRTYRRFPNERYIGMYQMTSPMLMIRDPELLKYITVKDFDHFTDHRSLIPENMDPLWNKNLFSLRGDNWRAMRATLSPAFTSSKMRAMFCLVNECAQQLSKYLEEQGSLECEMKDIYTRYANDVIATCAFGIKCDSLKERDNEFYLMGKKATNFGDLRRNLRIFLYILLPNVSKFVGCYMFSKEASEFFKSVISNNLKMREEQKVVRPDLIHLLMEARKGKLKHEEEIHEHDAGFATAQESEIGKQIVETKGEITDLDITAQAMIFFAAGFETVSTLMTFMAYELAVNPDIQQKLQQEIDDIEGDLTYEKLANMKYMDMVMSETLRKWPPAIGMDRKCVKPYTIPAERSNESPQHLNVGDLVWLPIVAIHRDPQYYPDPEKFDPERFNTENKQNIKPFTYNPFGYGPRNCIGSRFALMETKTVFFHLLSKCTIEVTEKSTIPLKVSKSQFNLGAEGGVWLGFKPRK